MATSEPKIVHSGTVQGLFQIALKDRLSEDAWRLLREAGLDLSVPLQPTYPLASWLRWQHIVLGDLWPHLPLDEAWRQLGHAVMEGLLATVLGRMLGVGARALGPQFMLFQLNRGFRGTDNYVETLVKASSPGRAELWLSDINDRPIYYVGVLEFLLTLSGAKEPRVSVLVREGSSCTYLLEWVK
ncbi:DUF2378 family protein [Myxococcus sp. CA051A]|uniref:DUF2378 family protein n=1 Tax=Myxococcus llanfairpwllgwyngyllgogerychwyrndrobwllllantysiliogogogochensis TaxID=2590453 RepID=A0A540X7L5_9BACT|nr:MULTISPECIES: DUF2378 family protein [Myxococcus]NTX05584.1 DUF2378 family protein [Myxococcus sp. CA040A]NTX50997.1 DUF2378 family protein [Myxococcus sp. CA039A]NTX67220.1 DUF2378 family protein [Myxococcus sp. CA051A]TQF17159.1 DUF2378 family protein [Myxococcus llanfairpwllgwyngyllgogerychwyrndrobwllllantysiliogogogochensis]